MGVLKLYTRISPYTSGGNILNRYMWGTKRSTM